MRYRFAKSPDIPAALAPYQAQTGCNPATATNFLSRQTLIPSARTGMPIWQKHLFAAMIRKWETPMSFFKLPIDRVVELGSQVEF